MWKLQIFVLVVVAPLLCVGSVLVIPPSCTFDNDWCQWRVPNNTEEFSWHLGRGSTRDRLSGPDGDHTTKNGNGSYIFIKGREDRDPSMHAVIESNVEVTSDLQISFWYFMNGIGIGNLTLSKVENGTKTELWRREGRQGPMWIQASVNLPRGNYMISFCATARLIYGGDLAVDDVEIAPITTTTHSPPSTIPPSRELPFSCNFDLESGACGMDLAPSIGNNVGWNITSMAFKYLGYTYIPGDASGGKGKYLLLNNWNLGENGDAAQIISPVLRNTGVACLSFKLYLAKISSGTLSVYQRLLPSMELVLLSEEAKKSSRTPSEWKTMMITLRNSLYFQVVMEGSYTGYLGSVIGVDDIKIENGDCVLTTTSATTLNSTQLSSSTTGLQQSTKLTTVSKTTKVGISSNLTTKSVPLSTTQASSPSSTSSSLSSPAITLSPEQSTASSTSSKSSTTTVPKKSSSTTLSSSLSSPATTSTVMPSSSSSSSSEQSTASSTSSKSSTTTVPKKSSSTTLSSSLSSPATTSSILLSTWLSTSLKSSTITPPPTKLTSSSTALSLTTRLTSTISPTSSLTSKSSRNSQLPSSTLKLSTRSSTSSSNQPPTAISSLFSTKRPAITSTNRIQTTKSNTEVTLSPESSTLSVSLPSTISESLLFTNVSKTMSILQLTTTTKSTTKIDISKTPTLTSHTPEGTSSTSSPTEVHNQTGRETTAIVLGVCLPIIALVIVSVIVLICKKDNGSKLNSIHNQKKIRKEEKNPYDNIEMDSQDVNKSQMTVTAFRKLEV